MPNPIINRRAVLGGLYISPFLQTWYKSLTIKPSNSLLNSLNILYDGMNNDGDLQEIDLIHPIAGLETTEQRLKPIKSTSGLDFTNVNSATLDTGGVTGNGTTSYLNLNWTPSTHGVKYTLDSACMGCYSRTSSTSANNDMGSVNIGTAFFLQIYSKFTDNKFYYRINNGVDLPGQTVTDSLALHAIARNDSATVESWYRGTSLGTEAVASTGLPTVSAYLCGSNVDGAFTQPSVRQLSFPFFGSKLVNQMRMYTRVQAFMTAREASV